MKNLVKYLIAAAVGTGIGLLIGYLISPYIIEEHQHWCDGVEVIRTIEK